MITVRHILALTALAALAACGGGSSPTTPAASTVPQTAAKANASLQVTLTLPAHYAVAKNASSVAKRAGAAAQRSPSYINPTEGDYLTVNVGGTPVLNPATGTTNFGLGTTNSDGSSTITVPISSGTYGYDTIVISEYNSWSDLIAQGYNEQYQNPDGSYNSGTLTVTPGSSNTLELIMNMNAQYIVLTTDPVAGDDATVITSFEQCFAVAAGQNVYAFAADDQSGYVLPGSVSGYGGGDPFTYAYPGVPPVTLQEQSPTNVGSTSKLAGLPLGWQFEFDGTYGINAQFFATNPLYENGISAMAQIAPSGDCG